MLKPPTVLLISRALPCISSNRCLKLIELAVLDMQRNAAAELAEEAGRLQAHIAAGDTQLQQAQEQLESLRSSTASTIQSLGGISHRSLTLSYPWQSAIF